MIKIKDKELNDRLDCLLKIKEIIQKSMKENNLTAKEFIDEYNKINQAEEESAVAIEDDIDNKNENNE